MEQDMEHATGLEDILEFRKAPSLVDKLMRRKKEREREKENVVYESWFFRGD